LAPGLAREQAPEQGWVRGLASVLVLVLAQVWESVPEQESVLVLPPGLP
jgi:hypothetical protein